VSATAQPEGPSTGLSTYTPPVAAISQTNETAGTILAARASAEVQARALIAMNRPRSDDAFRERILAACKRTRFADAAMYEKKIGGKAITGLSIRFAEECVRHYKNLDVSAILVSEDDDRRVFDVAAIDLETNSGYRTPVVVTKTVERKNTSGAEVIRYRKNSSGETIGIIRADDDALLVKQNALLAKAQREVVLKHIPSDVKEEAIDAIEALLKSKVEADPEGEKKKILDGFYSVGVTARQVEEFVGHPLTTVNPAEIFVLRRIWRGLADGESTWADVMAAKGKPAEAPTTGANAGLAAAIGTVTIVPAKDAATGTTAKAGPGTYPRDPTTAELRAMPKATFDLFKREGNGEILSDEEREELRQWRLDHPTA
jgi:hypothetical protein